MKKIPWIVQIIISLTIVYYSYKYFAYGINWWIVLIDVVYIVVTLTIIPLVGAIYYSAKTIWRIIFSICLIAVIFVQFETIIQTLEISHNQSHSLTIETIILVAGILSLAGPLIAFIVVFVEDKKSRNK